MVIRTDVRRTFTHVATLRGSQWYITLGLNEHSYDWFIQPDSIQHGVTEFWRDSEAEIIRVTFNSPITDSERGVILREIKKVYGEKLRYIHTYYAQQSEYKFWLMLKIAKEKK